MKTSANILHPYAMLWIIITLVEYLWLGSLTLQTLDFATVSWVVTFNIIAQVYTIRMKREPVISFFSAFILFYYVFHFGQVVLLGLFPEYEYNYLNYITSYMTNGTLLLETLKLCVISINMFFAGGLMLEARHLPKNASTVCRVNRKKVGKKLFVLLLPFRLVLDVLQVGAAFVGGYHAANLLMKMVPGYIASLANMWYAVVPLFFLELQSRQERKRYMLIVVLYMVATMVTGNRGHQMVSIVSLFIVALLLEQRISAKQWLKYGAIAVVGMLFIDVIYDLRNMGISAFVKNYADTIENTTNSNILLETLGTFGETIYTPYLVIEGYGSVYHTFFGECFLKSFFSVVPDVTGAFKDLNNQALFTKQLGTQNAIGGSFCGEMYYNFGMLYPVMSLVCGFLFAKMSYKITWALKTGEYNRLLLLLPLAVLLIWWVRDAVGNVTRQIVWLAIILHYIKSKHTTNYTFRNT